MSLSFIILEPYTTYSVSVAAETQPGYGERVNISCDTAADGKIIHSLDNEIKQNIIFKILKAYNVIWST